MSGYPIVSSEYLTDAGSRGLFGLGRRRRDRGELPRAGGHQIWVFRVNGRHIVDRGELAGDDEDLVRADLVTVVDIGKGVGVTVDLAIPSADAADFTMRVTFACTVTDPARVVRENINAEPAILGYLRRDGKLSHLGLSYRISDVNQVRREAAARIRAYTEVKPPDVPGLELRFVDVEVLTPEKLRTLNEEIRDEEAKQLLQQKRRGFDQTVEIDDERHRGTMSEKRRERTHQEEREDQQHTAFLKLQEQRTGQMREAERLEFARREVDFALKSFGTDPLKALIFAQARGEIDAKELAEQLAVASRSQEEYQRRQEELDREERRGDSSWQRGELTKDRDFERDERRESKREKRQDKRDRRREEREDRDKMLATRLDVLRELAKRGHLDMVNVKVEKLIAEIYDGAPGIATAQNDELTGNSAAPIESRPAAHRADTDDDSAPVDLDVDIKEENDDN